MDVTRLRFPEVRMTKTTNQFQLHAFILACLFSLSGTAQANIFKMASSSFHGTNALQNLLTFFMTAILSFYDFTAHIAV